MDNFIANRESIIRAQFEESLYLIKYLQSQTGLLASIADEMARAFRCGKKVLLCGNGGSAADAQHIAAELTGKFYYNRKPLPAVALTVNTSILTAIANDFGYDQVFSRQVQSLANEGDVVIGISTSGNSRNVILALQEARQLGAITVAFSGNGGSLRQTADYALCIPSEDTPRIQEAHIACGHMICYLVEESLFGKGNNAPAVFLDRDGTIVRDVPYCSKPGDLELLPGAGRSIKLLNDAGFKVILITNQSGISRGYFSEETLKDIHRKLKTDLNRFEAHLDGIYYCPHHPDQGCNCRKPKAGLILQAAREHGLDLASSFMIGDKIQDVEAGAVAGCKCILIDSGTAVNGDHIDLKSSLVAGSLAEAVRNVSGIKEGMLVK
jgi:D-sedoheptulose 7-phosphate isomerase